MTPREDENRRLRDLVTKGVELTQEPVRQPYGIDCAVRDPFGNHLRATPRVAGPVGVTDEDIARCSGN